MPTYTLKIPENTVKQLLSAMNVNIQCLMGFVEFEAAAPFGEFLGDAKQQGRTVIHIRISYAEVSSFHRAKREAGIEYFDMRRASLTDKRKLAALLTKNSCVDVEARTEAENDRTYKMRFSPRDNKFLDVNLDGTIYLITTRKMLEKIQSQRGSSSNKPAEMENLCDFYFSYMSFRRRWGYSDRPPKAFIVMDRIKELAAESPAALEVLKACISEELDYSEINNIFPAVWLANRTLTPEQIRTANFPLDVSALGKAFFCLVGR